MTGQQLFDWLTPEQREKFEKNTLAEEGMGFFDQHLKREYLSMGEFLGGAFMWYNTPEGYDYWERIMIECPDDGTDF